MVYEYKCKVCKFVFDMSHGMNESPEIKCPKCGEDSHKIFTTSDPIYKASGFYRTDNKK